MTIIFGGSFNPPTIAHYEIAKHIMDLYPEDEFVFLPTNDHYEKDALEKSKPRLEMLEIVCEKLGSRARVSDFELKLDRFYGTFFTLQHFKDPVFVLGADNMITLPDWMNYPKIIMDFKFIVIPRSDIDLEKFFLDNEIISIFRNHFLILDDFEQINLSSSHYRKTLDTSLLLEDVQKYIKKNDLYKGE